MSNATRTLARGDGYSLLPDYTPSSTPPRPASLDGISFKYPPSTQCRRDRPSKRQILYSTIYSIILSAIIVTVAFAIMGPTREKTYRQWLSTKMSSADPFDQLGLGAGVGPVERSMWGLHELGGWDGEAYEMEKGYLDLGKNATEKYKLYHEDSAEGALEYFQYLRQFIRLMPPRVQPYLLTSLHAHLPPALTDHMDPLLENERVKLGPPAMTAYKNIYQTDAVTVDPSSESAGFSRMWREFNEVDGWEMVFMNDTQMEEWVKETLRGTELHKTWNELHRGVLKADLLRYLLILLQGGVYSDMDTRPLRPIEHWGANSVEYLDISITDGPNYLSTLSAHPSLIIGVEMDVSSLNYKWYWPRPIQICQWTLSGAPFHPVYLDTIKRVMNATKIVLESGIEWADDDSGKGKNVTSGEIVRKEDIVSVLEWTGPPAFTDSVMQYLQSRYRVSWNRLRGIRHPLRIGDILILPTTAFASGTDTAGEWWYPQADVQHKFRGSWKTEDDVF